MKRIITLFTDFGDRDGYPGAVKGVISSINPQARLVDISHHIPPGNILAGAFCIFNSYRFYPKGTIHLAVVDPGVGSKRKAVLIQTERYFFIGPDNGIFSLALENEKIKKVITLTNSKYFLSRVSTTFHGRDIFGPVAAYVSLGVKPEEFGPDLGTLQKLALPQVRKLGHRLVGQIIHVDNFGNLVSNISNKELKDRQEMKIRIRARTMSNLRKTFSDVRPGELVAYMGSSNFLEVGLNQGNAASLLKARVGEKLEVLL